MIKINNLKFGYKRSRPIFEALSLELPAGRIYGLLGRNGEGKSTLLKLISGMIFPAVGEVESMGSDPTQREPSFMSQLYYIPEEIFSPNYSMNMYVRMVAPLYPNFSRADLDSYLSEFQLDPKCKASAMSLGQKKKFAIAFGLACNTKLLIMDEPTNGLDIPSKSQFRKIVSRVASEDRTIIISTHQVRDLDNLIDSIVILEQGQIVVNSSVDVISQRLIFGAIPEGCEALYEEGGVMGRSGVAESRDGECSRVDVELLFNAAVADPRRIGEILNR